MTRSGTGMTMTPWSRFLVQKQIVPKLLKKYGEFYENPKFYYCFYNCPICLPILSRINPINNLPFYFHKINFRINFLSTYTSSWPHSLAFPHCNPVCNPPVPHQGHMHRPLHFSWFNHLKSNGLRVQVMKFLIMQCLPLCCYLVPSSAPYSRTSSFFPCCERRSSTTIKWKGRQNIQYRMVKRIL